MTPRVVTPRVVTPRVVTPRVVTVIVTGAVAVLLTIMSPPGRSVSSSSSSTSMLVPLSAGAQAQNHCALVINGVDVAEFGEPDRALRVRADDVVRIDALTAEPSDRTTISIDLPIGPSIRVATIEHRLATRTTDRLALTEVSDFGVGWYHLEVESAGCRGAFWVNVYGRSPLTTVAGISATVVALAVVALVAVSVLRRRRGTGRWVVALVGGAVLGVALCVLAQQFSLVAFTVPAMAAFVAGGTAVSAGTTASVGAPRVGARVPAGAGPPLAPPVPPPSPPPPPAPPPPGSAPPASPPPPSTSGPPLTAAPTASRPPIPPSADAATADPPRVAFARLLAPEVVVAGEEFTVIVGLAPSRVEGVVGALLVRPPSSVGDYLLEVQMVADGFSLRAGETWRRSLPVTARDPYPTVDFHITPDRQDEAVHARTIQVLYSVDAQTMGLGARSVAVVATPELVASTLPGLPASDLLLTVPTASTAPDLTVRIVRGEGSGRLLWTFDSPHIDNLPDGEIVTDIGPEPHDFARQVLSEVAVHENQLTLGLALRGIGQTIGDEVPAQMWELLAKVNAAISWSGSRPTLLLLSDEAYVPWELAVMDPPLDPGSPPYLGAQVVMGRWVLGTRRPALPPPTVVDVHAMAVVSGVYEQPGWRRLIEAEHEAATLSQRYQAVAVEAVTEDVVACLGGTPVAQALHFALHGRYDPSSTKQGLILIDGNPLDPFVVKGARLTSGPFVFLNACQVGSGNEVLGDYAGMAASFLYAGAAAVVAPLWSIDDGVARTIAEHFYEQAFAGIAPAEILRSERASFGAGATTPTSSASLAYQFFGHPSLRLLRTG